MVTKSQVMQIPASGPLQMSSSINSNSAGIVNSPSVKVTNAQSSHSSSPSISLSATAMSTVSLPSAAPAIPTVPEIEQQQQGMTVPSTANQSLLQSEPCNAHGLPSKRPKDQAEGNFQSPIQGYPVCRRLSYFACSIACKRGFGKCYNMSTSSRFFEEYPNLAIVGCSFWQNHTHTSSFRIEFFLDAVIVLAQI